MRKVTVDEARELAKLPDVVVVWRPEAGLRESDQYCLVREVGVGEDTAKV